MVKGADSSLASMCASNDSHVSQVTRDIDNFSSKGLRTLAFAYKEISDETLSNIREDFYTARIANKQVTKNEDSIEEKLIQGDDVKIAKTNQVESTARCDQEPVENEEW
jgi:phospholipid-translocating ATPase